MYQNNLQVEFSNLLIEDNQLNFGLSINSVGNKTILSNEKMARASNIKDYKYQYKKGRIANEFKLIYITSGSGFIHFDGRKEIEIQKGNILFVFPNQKYEYYHNKESEWKEYFIRFEADILYDKFVRTYFTDDNQVVDIGFNEELVKIFQRSIDVVRNALNSSQVYLSGMLLHILGLIISESKYQAKAKIESQMIEQAKTIMTENIFEKLNLNDLAYKLNVSYSALRMKFKQYTGTSPAKYFSELRLNKSKELLIETNYSGKEIAFMLQFSNHQHFITSFKKSIGKSPSEFKQSYLDKHFTKN